jgi:hypothetical protein
MANKLPVNTAHGGSAATGYCTPKIDKTPQTMSVPPKRVIPIIFIPGIMGSNLRMSASRQALVQKSNNIAWRPDYLFEGVDMLSATPAQRQLQLDPETTELDIYEQNAPTGDSSETANARHTVPDINVHLKVGIDTPLLTDELPAPGKRILKEVKARKRGWSEIYFGSYRKLLETCEQHLNSLEPFQPYGYWRQILAVDPLTWRADPSGKLKPISFPECKKALSGCWYPVHAMGYNWLVSNRVSGSKTAKRIRELMEKYRNDGYQCEKVIIVTHSMGGLVARAIIHPEMGALASEVLGVVHGAMPAIGAPAAYKRMRCGFEDGPVEIAAKVLGNYGSEVTAVLGNSVGGLELLPSKAYGNKWLEIRQNKNLLLALPVNGDPYSEIYLLRNKWYSLLRPEWINPAGSSVAGIENSFQLLEKAKNFHLAINSTYHENSYGHYSAEIGRPSWQSVVWNLSDNYQKNDWGELAILSDNRKGKITLRDPKKDSIEQVASVSLGPSVGAGDQTVPLQSAEHQLLSGKFKGVFRQVGYEHQSSYSDDNALNATIYSLVRIIETMVWNKNEVE